MRLSAEFTPTQDRRGQPLLVRDDFDRSCTGILPGGFKTAGEDAPTDIALFWRLARWHHADGLIRDLAPDVVEPTTLVDVIEFQAIHSDWILEQAQRQAEIVASFLGKSAMGEKGEFLALQRTRYVAQELESGVQVYESLHGYPPEDRVTDRLEALKTALEAS